VTDVETPKPPRSRPWFAVAIFLLLIPAGLTCWFQYVIWAEWTLEAPGSVWKDGRPIGADFVQFAAVAEAWRLGRIDEIYESQDRQREFFTRAAHLWKPYAAILSFNYPPFTCWLLRPMASLTYRHRWVAWTLLQFSFALAALWCWRKELGPRAFGIVALGWFLSPPVCNTFILGHQAFMALGIVSVVLFLLNRERDFLAGLALSLLLYKPPLGIVLGPMLMLARRWWAVLGVAIGAVLLAAASLAVSLKACQDYRGMAKELLDLAFGWPDYYVKHFNLLAFVATYLDVKPYDFTWMHWSLVIVPCLMLFALTAKAWCFPWRPGTSRWSAGASAALLTTLVSTPYLYSYDTMIAAIAGVYSVKTWNERPEWHRWYILACVAIAGYFVAGDITLMEQMQKLFGFRLQLAPLAFAAWAVLESLWAINTRNNAVSQTPNTKH